MKQIGNLLFVELPENMIGKPTLINGNTTYLSCEYRSWYDDNTFTYIDIPPGKWTSIGRLSELGYSELGSLVERRQDGGRWWYRDYEKSIRFTVDLPIDSVNSLLQSHSLPTNKDYYILKLNKP